MLIRQVDFYVVHVIVLDSKSAEKVREWAPWSVARDTSVPTWFFAHVVQTLRPRVSGH
jgi:hypothetical protein